MIYMMSTLIVSLLLLFVLLIPFAVPIVIISVIKNAKKAGAKNVCYSGMPQQPCDNGVQQQSFPGQPAQRSNKPDLTVSTILFLIGTCFVVLSGLAFGAASWVRTSHEGRAAIIAAASAVSFALSAVVYRFLKLSGTSISFYSLGTGLAATLILTAGHYELMGEWFNLHGDGSGALIASACALSSFLFFIGGRIFGKKVFSYTGLSAAAFALFFTAVQIGGEFEATSAILIVLQTVLTAFIYIRPSGKRQISAPVKIVGTIASLFYASVALIYVLISAIEPTVLSYIIMGLIISQLIFYGVLANNKKLIAVQTVFSVFTAYMAAITTTQELSFRMSVIVFGIIVIAIYLIHRFVPQFRNGFSEIFSFGAVVYAGFIGISQAGKDGFVPELLIAAAAAVIVALYIFDKKKGVQIFAGISAPILPICITESLHYCITASDNSIGADTANVLCWSGLTFIFIAFAAFLLILPRISFSFHAHHPRKTNTALYSLLITSGIILLFISGYSSVFMFPAALCILHFALSNRLRINIPAVLSVFSAINVVHSVTYHYLPGYYPVLIAMIVTFISFMILSKAVYPNAFIEKKNGRYIFDTFLLCAWLPILLMIDSSESDLFIMLMAAGIYAAGFIKKNTSKTTKRVLFTVTTVIIAEAIYVRPFLIPASDMISSKITLAVFALTGVILRFIWRADDDCAKLPTNILFIIAFSGLLYDMLIFDTALNTIFGMSVMLFILMVSIITKNRTWFLTSSIALFTVTLYSTREYLMALSWWVYLFFAGLVLIVIAAANEYYKTKGETVKTTVSNKFKEWNW